MALKIGSLYVALTAQTDGFAKGIAGALKDVEKFSREVKRAAGEASKVGLSVAAIGGAALRMASDLSGPTKAAMDDLHRSTQQLAVPVAQMLLPAVRALTADIRSLAGSVAGLSPHAREVAATAAKWAVEFGAVAFVVARVAGLVQGLAGVLSAVFGAVAAVGVGPILAIVAAIALAAAGVAALHAAFRTNFLGIGDIARKFFDWFGSNARGVFDRAGEFIRHWVVEFIDGLREMTTAYALIQEKLGNTKAAAGGFQLAEQLNALGKKVREDGLGVFTTTGLELGRAMGDAFISEWKRILGDLGVSKLLNSAKGVLAGGGGSGRPIAAPVTADLSSLTGRFNDAAFGKGSSFGVDNHPGDDLMGWDRASQQQSQLLTETAKATAEAMARAADYFKHGEGAVKVALANIGAGMQVAGQIFLSKLGRVGEVVNAAAQGFQAGGLWGAIIAAVASLLTMTEGFGKLLGYLEATLGEIIKVFEPLIEAIAGLSNVTGPLKPILEVLSFAFKIIGSVILAVVIAVGAVWNAIVDIFDPDRTSKFRVDNEANAKALSDIWATDKHTTATVASTAAIQRFTESLLNVPEGFRLGALSFAAQNAGAGGFDPNTVPGIGGGARTRRPAAATPPDGEAAEFEGGGGVHGGKSRGSTGGKNGASDVHPEMGKMGARAGATGGDVYITGPITVVAPNVDAFLAELERRAKLQRAVQFGNPATAR